MTRVRNFRVAVGALVMAASILGGGLVGVATASAKTKPVLIVTPALNLKNGESVTLTGTGFKPGDTLFLVECQRTAKGQSGCNASVTSIPPSATVTKAGKIPPTKVKVVTGTVGPGKCGTTKANVNKCEMSAGNITGGDTASAPITFKLK
jgi:hypothetical protein